MAKSGTLAIKQCQSAQIKPDTKRTERQTIKCPSAVWRAEKKNENGKTQSEQNEDKMVSSLFKCGLLGCSDVWMFGCLDGLLYAPPSTFPWGHFAAKFIIGFDLADRLAAHQKFRPWRHYQKRFRPPDILTHSYSSAAQSLLKINLYLYAAKKYCTKITTFIS